VYEDFFREYQSMTDLQKKLYKSSVVGTRVIWTANVEDVSEEGRIQLQGFADYPYIWVYLDGVSIGQVATLNKGQSITFEAMVRETGTGRLGIGFALYLDDPIVVSVD
jgi:hypothetical protein